MSKTDAPDPVEMPEAGDLIWAPQYCANVVVADDVTRGGEVLVHHTNGQLLKIPAEHVEAWYRPYWRRRDGLTAHRSKPTYLLEGDVLR